MRLRTDLTVDKVLTGGKLFVDGEIKEGALAIDEGTIAWIGKESRQPSATETMALKGRIIIPGIVDLHVHLRDQKFSRKETFSSGTRAAAMGGVTSVADMPNNDPPTNSPKALEQRMRKAEGETYVNTAFYSLLRTKKEIISTIVQKGAIGFKFFTYNPLDGFDPEDIDILTKVFKVLKREKMPLAIHAESSEVLFKTAAAMSEKELDNPVRYPDIRPPRAETEIVKKIIEVTREVRNPVHLCHLSTKMSVDMVREAKATGIPITCEVTPHHLLLSNSQMRKLGSKGIVNPPLRSREDILGLWGGVLDGTVDILASDHAPHERSEKESESVTGVMPGFSGLETLVSTMLTQVIMGRMDLNRFVRMTSTKPVEILGLGRRGRLKKDYHADLTIIDPKEESRIDPSKFESKAKHSPFKGYVTKGKVTATIVDGQVVMEEGEIVSAKAAGQILRRGQI